MYVGSDDSRLYAIDGATGILKWSFDSDSSIVSSSAIQPDGSVVFASLLGKIYVVRDAGTNGTPVWIHDLDAPTHASPTLGADGTVFIGADDNNLYALSAVSGDVLWSFKAGADVRSSASISQNGIVYFGSDDGNVYALGPATPDECRLAFSDPNAQNHVMTLDSEIGRYQCIGNGVTYCQALLVATEGFDTHASALQYMAGTIGPGQHLALDRDRARKMKKALKDPALLEAYCEGDGDDDLVPDPFDVCPDTPPLTPTDDTGCTDSTIPSAPIRPAVDFILESMGIFYDPSCVKGAIPNMPTPTAICSQLNGSTFAATTLAFTPVINQAPDCSVFYQIRLDYGDAPEPTSADRHVGLVKQQSDLGTHFPDVPGRPGDSTVDLTTNTVDFYVTVRMRAMNGNGSMSPWSPGIRFAPGRS